MRHIDIYKKVEQHLISSPYSMFTIGLLVSEVGVSRKGCSTVINLMKERGEIDIEQHGCTTFINTSKLKQLQLA